MAKRKKRSPIYRAQLLSRTGYVIYFTELRPSSVGSPTLKRRSKLHLTSLVSTRAKVAARKLHHRNETLFILLAGPLYLSLSSVYGKKYSHPPRTRQRAQPLRSKGDGLVKREPRDRHHLLPANPRYKQKGEP